MAVLLRLWKLNEDSVAGFMNDCTLWQFAVILAGGFVEMPETGLEDEFIPSLSLLKKMYGSTLWQPGQQVILPPWRR